jgi:hypothetical protein
MNVFDRNLIGLGQNYLWEKYPGEIAPLGATVVDGMAAFQPAHTSTVGLGHTGLSGCPACERARGMGQTDPTTTPPSTTGGAPLPTPPSAVDTTSSAPVSSGTNSSSTNIPLLVTGIAAVALGLGGIAWLAHNRTTAG